MDSNIVVKDISSVEKQIQVTIPADTVADELDKCYLDLRKSVKIKGFRPGKVPRSILERFYGKQVENQVVNKLINDTFQSTIKGENIQPVSEPIIDNDKLVKGGDFTYTARVEVRPEIALEGKYLGLEVEREKFHVTDDNVEIREKTDYSECRYYIPFSEIVVVSESLI